MIKASAFGLAACLSLALAGAGRADDLAVEAQFSKTKLAFGLKSSLDNVTLSIAGPNGFHASVSAEDAAPAVDLAKFGAVEDGEYIYELTASTDEMVKDRMPLDNGRDGDGAAIRQSVAASGTFIVKDGVIVTRGTTSEPDVVGGAAGDDQD
jgi:hypothetical protein